MWFLTSEKDDKVIYFTPATQTIVIGRSVDKALCDIPFPQDNSISRRHCSLSLVGNDLTITDLGSKYGTFITNDDSGDQKKKLEANVSAVLHRDDKITFGILGNDWQVNKANFKTCASTMKGENLQSLRAILSKINGTFTNEWDNTCGYLTMPAITLTIKVVLALIQGSHIVTLDFWKKCFENIRSQIALPDPNNFVPAVIETTLNKEVVSFLPNKSRRILFAGKTFLFFSNKQYSMYVPVLELGSASAVLVTDATEYTLLTSQDVIVIQCNANYLSQETNERQNTITKMVNYLKSNGKRLVTDAEIGLAILFCSLEKYCNPEFSFTSEIIKGNKTVANKEAKVLVQESQETTKHDGQNVLINQSLTQNTHNVSNTQSNKRKTIDEDDIQSNANKKLATQPSEPMNGNDADEFNFHKSENMKVDNNTSDTLNLARAPKRKPDDSGKDDDDLFNFLGESKPLATSDSSFFKQEPNDYISPAVKRIKREKIEIKPVKFLSLKELLENSTTWKSSNEISEDTIKTENISDIEHQMTDLTLGTTIVTIKKELLVENKIEAPTEPLNNVKNFKKFKKVWPVKMEITIIPSSSMTVVRPDASVLADINLSDSEEEEEFFPRNGPNKQQSKITKYIKA